MSLPESQSPQTKPDPDLRKTETYLQAYRTHRALTLAGCELNVKCQRLCVVSIYHTWSEKTNICISQIPEVTHLT